MDKHIFWISSYPKSGNTLVRAMISALFFSKDGKFQLDQLKHSSQFEKRSRLNILKNINNEDFLNLDKLKVLSKYWLILQDKKYMGIEKGFGFMKSHSCFVSLFNNWFTNSLNTAGYIYIVRDPRNVVTSYAHHNSITIEESADRMISSLEYGGKTSSDHISDRTKVYMGS